MKNIKHNLTVRYLRRVRWSIWYELYSKRTDDYTFIQRAYKKATGREVNFCNPTRYTEKQQWLKLFYRDSLIERCSDKYEMKQYLAEQGMPELAVPVYRLYDSVTEIRMEDLPQKFVMKATHGSGWNMVVQDKSCIDWPKWRRLFAIWQKQNPNWFGREWNYAALKPRILVEEYMQDDSGELRDYKIFCFNGKATYMQIDENRSTNHRRKYYDRDGNLLGIQDDQNHKGELSVHFGALQGQMFAMADKLSKPFPLVRVDFYECNGKLFVGELTFFGASGFFSFEPDEIDEIWGKQIVLPEPNYNLELYRKIHG